MPLLESLRKIIAGSLYALRLDFGANMPSLLTPIIGFRNLLRLNNNLKCVFLPWEGVVFWYSDWIFRLDGVGGAGGLGGDLSIINQCEIYKFYRSFGGDNALFCLRFHST